MERTIFVTFEFSRIHCYPDAKNYLKHPHRHVFKGRVDIPVNHNDRDVEFIWLKEQVERCVSHWNSDLGRCSCETMATNIADFVLDITPKDWVKVEISEDGENGATIKMTREDKNSNNQTSFGERP